MLFFGMSGVSDMAADDEVRRLGDSSRVLQAFVCAWALLSGMIKSNRDVAWLYGVWLPLNSQSRSRDVWRHETRRTSSGRAHVHAN
jgi:hypothetical protein